MKGILLFFIALACCVPVRAGVIVVGNLARTANVRPGDTIEGVIYLKNTGSKSAQSHVFQTDYVTTAEGSSEYGDPGTAPRSNAAWISVTPSRVVLEAGETVPVRYKARVPEDKRLRGTYWSMIMIEPNGEAASVPEGKEGKVAVGLETKIRFGVQIVTELAGDGARSLKVAGKTLLRDETGQSLQLDICNDGERLLAPLISVELYDSAGASVGRFEGGRNRIYPSCSIRSRMLLNGIPAGKYTAMVLLDGGDDQVMGAQYDLELGP